MIILEAGVVVLMRFIYPDRSGRYNSSPLLIEPHETGRQRIETPSQSIQKSIIHQPLGLNRDRAGSGQDSKLRDISLASM